VELNKYDIAIVGGGLSGLVSAIELGRAGYNVALFEKQEYPFHKVCGEYLSNEVKPYLIQLGLNLQSLNLPHISKLEISGISEKAKLQADLPLGGFGISRYLLDSLLLELAKYENVKIFTGTKINAIEFNGGEFSLKTAGKVFSAGFCIGSYGKRDTLDKKFERNFIQKKSPYLAVKYHVSIDFPGNTIGMYYFNGGYCGISPIEDGKFCLCYLSHRSNMNGHRSIESMEKEVLFQNKDLKKIFETAVFLYKSPKVINEISFQAKSKIENHVIMCGDTAGMISPFCGNGMAMAINSARMLSRIIISNSNPNRDITAKQRLIIENQYKKKWGQQFKIRLGWGRMLQSLSGNTRLSGPLLQFANAIKPFKRWIIKQTHGKEVNI
jgi:menaquinone-9 beta-reductase